MTQRSEESSQHGRKLSRVMVDLDANCGFHPHCTCLACRAYTEIEQLRAKVLQLRASLNQIREEEQELHGVSYHIAALALTDEQLPVI